MKIINYVHIFNKWAKTKMVATLISSSPLPSPTLLRKRRIATPGM